MKTISRTKELACVVLGHKWGSHSTSQDITDGKILAESRECDRCGLSQHDITVAIDKFKDDYGLMFYGSPS